MLLPYKERQQALITNNIISACTDVNAITKMGYGYLMNCKGFDTLSFDEFLEYFGKHSLADMIQANIKHNLWVGVSESDPDFKYYKSKAEIYKRIVDKLS